MEGKQKFSIGARIKSFRYAFEGLGFFLKNDHNGRIHAFAAVFAVALSWYFSISALEWIAVLFAITAVFVAEIINAAIEKLADVVSPKYHPKVKIVKDSAAAAVLIAALLALAVAMIIFIPKLFL